MAFADWLVSGPVTITWTTLDLVLTSSDTSETDAGVTASAGFNREGLENALGLPELRPCSQPAGYFAAVVRQQ
jgi:hypothetical protein